LRGGAEFLLQPTPALLLDEAAKLAGELGGEGCTHGDPECLERPKTAKWMLAVVMRGSVVECSSPLELCGGLETLESAGGLAHSRTLARRRGFLKLET